MGRAADSLEGTCYSLEPKPRPAAREDSEFSRRGFDEASSGARLFLRNGVPRNRATRDLPFRADRNGLEHVAVAICVVPSSRAMCCGSWTTASVGPLRWKLEKKREASERQLHPFCKDAERVGHPKTSCGFKDRRPADLPSNLSLNPLRRRLTSRLPVLFSFPHTP